MKKTVIFLLTAVLLAGTASVAQAQKKQAFTENEASSIFQKMHGSWQVKTLIWQPTEKNFFEAYGTVRYSPDANKATREEFDIALPDGSTQHYEGMLRYAADKERFEFVAYDADGSPTMMLHGKWDPRFNMIALKPVKGQMQADGKRKLRMRLQYFFFDDGSFKKVTKTPDGRGDYLIASEYHCKQQNTVGL